MLGKYNKKQVQSFYEEHGYYIFRNVIPQEMIEQSLNEIDFALQSQWKLYFSQEDYPGMDHATVRLFNRNRHYRRVMYEWLNKRMLRPYNYPVSEQVKTICDWIGLKATMFQMAANRFHLPDEDNFKTGVHQDIGIMLTESSVTFWLPLVAALRSNGSIKLWDKSHHEHVLVPEGIDYRGHSWISDATLEKYDEVWEEYQPGDLLLFHTKTIHTSTSNKSDNCRWSTIFRFDNAEDNQYFDMQDNPLEKGYIMENDKKAFSGFKKDGKSRAEK